MSDGSKIQRRSVTPAYFANAAIGLMSDEVAEATIAHLHREVVIGGPAAAAEAAAALTAGYAAAARLIGAESDEVAFVESGNRALASLIQSAALGPRDHVLVDRTCWGGTLDMLASFPGVTIDVMPVDADGRVDPDATRRFAHPATKLIVLTWCPATCAIVNPAAAIGDVAHALGAFYIVDACQLVGQRVVDVTQLRCHGLAASGRKWLRGPRGTALLYASRDYLAATRAFMPDQFGRRRSDARRYETGEAFVAGRVGLTVAIGRALTTGMGRIEARLAEIATLIRTKVDELPGVSILERGPDLASFVTIDVTDAPAAHVAAELARDGIVVSAPDSAYTPLDMKARGLASVVRIAPHLFTQDEDVDRLIVALHRLRLARRP